jgi:hypothetical protein
VKSTGASIRAPEQSSSNDALWHQPAGCAAGIGDIGYFKFLSNVHVIDIGAGLTEPARDQRGKWSFNEAFVRQRVKGIRPCALWVQTDPDGLPVWSRHGAALSAAQDVGYRLSHILPMERKPDLGNYFSVWIRPDISWTEIDPLVVKDRTARVLEYIPYDSNAKLQSEKAAGLLQVARNDEDLERAR